MSNILIMNPYEPAAISATRGSGVDNLLTPDPKENWIDSVSGSDVTISLDLGSARQVDSFFVGYTNAAGSTDMGITYGVSVPGDAGFIATRSMLPSTRAASGRRHTVTYWPGTNVVRYVDFTFNKPTGAALRIGVIAVGAAFVPEYNQEWGAGRQVVDLSTVEELAGGGFARELAARKASYRWTLGDLDQDEVDRLYALALDRGNSQPMLVVEDPDLTDGQSERCHWGLFNRLDSYERVNPNLNRWAFSINQWV